MLALQRTVGNRATAQLLQRYKRVGTGGYASAAVPGGRAPFTAHGAEVELTADRRFFEYPESKPAAPDLLVADDGSLAVADVKFSGESGESKEFYADASVIARANKDLERGGSPIRLAGTGNTVTLPGSKPLQMVQPETGAHKLADLAVDKYVTLAKEVCVDVAMEIMGSGRLHTKIGGGTGLGLAEVGAPEGTMVYGTRPLAERLAQGGAVSVDEARTQLERGGAQPSPGKAYGEAIKGPGGGAAEASVKGLGINKYAWSRVGEGYVTQSVAADTSKGELVKGDYSKAGAENDFTWGYHFGAVVAESNDHLDAIVMENYRRTGDWKAGAEKLLAELRTAHAATIGALALDADPQAAVAQIKAYVERNQTIGANAARTQFKQALTAGLGAAEAMWYFRMVGKGAGQSWHEQMASTPYFFNPISLAVTSLKADKETVVWFDAGETITATDDAKLVALAERLRRDMHKAPRIRLAITGYDDRAKGARGARRAEAVARRLAELKFPRDWMTVTDGGVFANQDPAHPETSRRVTVRVTAS